MSRVSLQEGSQALMFLANYTKDNGDFAEAEQYCTVPHAHAAAAWIAVVVPCMCVCSSLPAYTLLFDALLPVLFLTDCLDSFGWWLATPNEQIHMS